MTAIWGKITAGEIESAIHGELTSGHKESSLKGLSTDSRDIKPGQLFLALKGEKFDGHKFITRAIEKGAHGLIVEKGSFAKNSTENKIAVIEVKDTLKALGDLASWWRQQHDIKVAAITGSAGKTTIKEMAAEILSLSEKTLKNRGNFNNLIGLPLTILKMDQKDQIAILEMGMNYPGEIARLTEIADPDIGLICNVAKAHLEGLGDIQGVARAKTELIDKISTQGSIILNGDDQLLMETAARFGRKTLSYGLGPENDIRAENIQYLGDQGLSFDLKYDGDSILIRIQVPGKQNLSNALAASAIAISLNAPIHNIKKGLNDYKGVKGRFMPFSLPGGITLIDDTYNSNPSSLKAALYSVKELAKEEERMIIGLGEMLELGDETVAAHQEAGEWVAKIGASYLFTIGEHAHEMVRAAQKNGFPTERAIVVNSHQEMEQQIAEVMKEGDLILLKGSRGMKLDVVSESLKERCSGGDQS